MELGARMSPLMRTWQGRDQEVASTQVAMSDPLWAHSGACQIGGHSPVSLVL